MFCVSVKPWRHSDVLNWVHFSRTLRILEVLCLVAVWNFNKRTGFPWLGHQSKGRKGPVRKAYMPRDHTRSNSLIILFYPTKICDDFLHMIEFFFKYIEIFSSNLPSQNLVSTRGLGGLISLHDRRQCAAWRHRWGGVMFADRVISEVPIMRQTRQDPEMSVFDLPDRSRGLYYTVVLL
jgi:hypothetical protein